MASNPEQTFLQRLLHIKPSPLIQGDKGVYIFVHINKTAGTSIGKAIGLSVKDHLTVKEIISRVGRQQWESAYKFTLVRNPWDKVVSLYEYRRKKNKTRIASRGISFEDWVIKTHGTQQDAFYYDNPKSFQPQVEWLKDDEGRLDIDFVGKFESIQEDFEQIKKAIGSSAKLPHLNATKRRSYKDYYNDETREIVAHWYRHDIAEFGYTFD